MSRDLIAERELLTEAGGDTYAEAVIARLDEAAAEYGDSFTWCSRSQLWDELGEEAIDLSGWSVLALRRLELDHTPPRELARLRALLLTIARYGAQADALIGEARRIAAATTGTGAA